MGIATLSRHAQGLRARIAPIWRLNVAIVAATAGLLTVVGDYTPLESALVPWWVLAAAIAITERWPVSLEFGRSVQSFSLTDLPLTLALLLLGGAEAVLAVLCGGAVALGLRRLPPVKFVFNLAQHGLAVCLGLALIHAVAKLDPGFGWPTWLAAIAATQLGGLVTIALICAAIYLTERTITRDRIRQLFGIDAMVTVTNTSLALIFTVILLERPVAAPLLLIPVCVMFLGYRAFASERRRHEQLEVLYEANRTLSASPEIADALQGLLVRAAEAFRAEQAEVILFSADGGPPLRTSLGVAFEREVMVPMQADVADALRAMATAAGGPIRLEPPLPPALADYLEARGVRHGMLGVLHGEERVIGTIMLANRFGVARGFTGEDVALFDTLAANASAALQYDRLEQAVSELRDLQDQLHHQAFHDPLTGLANRTLFTQRLREAVEDPATGTVAAMFLDLDDFKSVNDSLGHQVGDDLLKAMTSRFLRCVRAEDVVARVGGDEFAILLAPADHPEELAVEVAERILRAFQLPVEVGHRLIGAGLSIGIATTEHSGRKAEDLVRDADVAMYEAKAGGKRRYALFNPAMRDVIVRRHDIKQELELALERRELIVEYQPIMDLATGEMWSVEALVRWIHPERGRIAPGEFIPVAEQTGLIARVGRYVLEEACGRAAEWRTAGPGGTPLPIQVNLSAAELEDPGLVGAVRDVLARTGMPPQQLVLEITETLLVKDAERGAATLHALRALGVRIALDDFGTGYSSLSYLRNLPLDVLKVAREFVDGLGTSDETDAFVRLIVGLAKTVGLKVIAEGIETDEQLAVLREVGTELGQGFRFSRPVAPDALLAASGAAG